VWQHSNGSRVESVAAVFPGCRDCELDAIVRWLKRHHALATRKFLGENPGGGIPDRVMAHTAAANIAAQIRGEQPTHTKDFGDIKAVLRAPLPSAP
jgi:hypothetical protein